MKSVLAVFSLLTLSIYSNGQYATLSGGGEGTGPGGTVSYSIGQLVVETTEDSEGTVSPGVQQSYESYVVFIDEVLFSNSLTIFPNPTSDLLQIDFDQPFIGTIKVFNIYGGLMWEQVCTGQTFFMDAQKWASGTYLLNVMQESNLVSTYKIVKQ